MQSPNLSTVSILIIHTAACLVKRYCESVTLATDKSERFRQVIISTINIDRYEIGLCHFLWHDNGTIDTAVFIGRYSWTEPVALTAAAAMSTNADAFSPLRLTETFDAESEDSVNPPLPFSTIST